MSFTDMLGWVGVAVIIPAFVMTVSGSPERLRQAHGLYAIGCTFGFLASAVHGDHLWSTINGLLAAINAWLWWRGRRKGRGRKALRELGAKSRARIEAMTRRITPSPIPSPVGGGS